MAVEAPACAVPWRVQDLVWTRLRSCDEEHLQALAAGVVISRPFHLRLWRFASGLPELQVLSIVEQLMR